MLRAEKRLNQTKAKLAEEQRAHEATKQRLANLERRRKDRGDKGETPKERRQKGAPTEPEQVEVEAARPSKAERRAKRSWLRRAG